MGTAVLVSVVQMILRVIYEVWIKLTVSVGRCLVAVSSGIDGGYVLIILILCKVCICGELKREGVIPGGIFGTVSESAHCRIISGQSHDTRVLKGISEGLSLLVSGESFIRTHIDACNGCAYIVNKITVDERSYICCGKTPVTVDGIIAQGFKQEIVSGASYGLDEFQITVVLEYSHQSGTAALLHGSLVDDVGI